MATDKSKFDLFMKWLVASPYARSSIPAIVGAIIGLLTNLLSTAIYRETVIEWANLPKEGTFWAIVILLAIGIGYQNAIYKFDNKSVNILDSSKQELAGSITDFYKNKIRAGDINDLVDADRKLRKVFESNS